MSAGGTIVADGGVVADVGGGVLSPHCFPCGHGKSTPQSSVFSPGTA